MQRVMSARTFKPLEKIRKKFRTTNFMGVSVMR